MNHIELKPYPFPEGVTIPRLMPYQEYPWNGDGYLAAEVLRLKEAHGLRDAIETGTCLGSTALWLSQNFEFVWTCEVNASYYEMAVARLSQTTNTSTARGSSLFILPEHLQGCEGDPLVFLDAHWLDQCPLLDELKDIAKSGAMPCIVIHDFLVPGTDFGYDKMPDGRPFSLELVRPYMDRIYGADLWVHNYPTHVEGAKRGWASFEPLRL